jgi:NAD(P)-dependent dehydrogenase (short-subunit alcohol dehydrogenase family)
LSQWFAKEGIGAHNPEYLAKRTAATPLRRIGEPVEIGPMVAFLASPAAALHHWVGDRARWQRDNRVTDEGGSLVLWWLRR